ncbi:preprotein translocase subunit YajC [Tessaracoccus sp. MC1756]|uniref:preprotein translocase subunit YajC n=1 Tax=Tessaracoccus sp. MC1756 TaxID=2760311 RepID=UPI001604379A|nr:preprotein translocase subunit YajC [Tessaracoccus sp. MC1756]MBB1510052.1 preprotein translocase subunit YajC [Tessaracoccus sp. MC1756]
MPPGFDLIIMIVAMIALFYFMIIRPQRKRMQQHQEMQQQLVPGARVLLTSGMFGTVVHVGERQLIVELAPGAEVTVLKGNVARTANPDEEEFEFDDAPADVLSTEPVITDEEFQAMYGSDEQADTEPSADVTDPNRNEDPK